MSGTLAARRVDVGPELTEMWRSALYVVPRLFAFLVIVGIGWLSARLVRRLAVRLLDRFGFDRLVGRAAVGRALLRTRYRPGRIVCWLGYHLLLLLTLQFAFAVWGPNPASDLLDAVVGWLPQALAALVVVVVAAAIANAVRDLVLGALGDLSYRRVLADLVSTFIVGVGTVAGFVQAGVAPTVTVPLLVTLLATVAGILVVGVGGGLVRPMQRRWEEWLRRFGVEARARAGRSGPVGEDLDHRFAAPRAEGRAAVVPLADPPLADVPTSPAADGLATFPTGLPSPTLDWTSADPAWPGGGGDGGPAPSVRTQDA